MMKSKKGATTQNILVTLLVLALFIGAIAGVATYYVTQGAKAQQALASQTGVACTTNDQCGQGLICSAGACVSQAPAGVKDAVVKLKATDYSRLVPTQVLTRYVAYEKDSAGKWLLASGPTATSASAEVNYDTSTTKEVKLCAYNRTTYYGECVDLLVDEPTERLNLKVWAIQGENISYTGVDQNGGDDALGTFNATIGATNGQFAWATLKILNNASLNYTNFAGIHFDLVELSNLTITASNMDTDAKKLTRTRADGDTVLTVKGGSKMLAPGDSFTIENLVFKTTSVACGSTAENIIAKPFDEGQFIGVDTDGDQVPGSGYEDDDTPAQDVGGPDFGFSMTCGA